MDEEFYLCLIFRIVKHTIFSILAASVIMLSRHSVIPSIRYSVIPSCYRPPQPFRSTFGRLILQALGALRRSTLGELFNFSNFQLFLLSVFEEDGEEHSNHECIGGEDKPTGLPAGNGLFTRHTGTEDALVDDLLCEQ